MARTAMSASKRAGLYSTPVWSHPEAASFTGAIGSVLVFSSGFLSEDTSDPDNIAGVSVKAGSNDSTAGDSRLPYVPALPHIVFEANIDDSGDLGNGAYVDSDGGKLYGLAVDANDVWYIDKAETSNTRVVVHEPVDPVARDAADADSSRDQARVYFTFLADQTIWGAQ